MLRYIRRSPGSTVGLARRAAGLTPGRLEQRVLEFRLRAGAAGGDLPSGAAKNVGSAQRERKGGEAGHKGAMEGRGREDKE